jgi:Domain of unknown function (DUF4832)
MAVRTSLLTVGCLAVLTAAGLSADPESVVVRPREIHDVLVNPGMGIQTFQRFAGQPINPGLTWSEEGPLAKAPAAPGPPDFPGSSIAYCRWFWAALEPEQGHVRWEIIDAALAEARAHGQTLAIRLMPYDEQHPLPGWYRASGARRANTETDKDGRIWQPDFSDPLYLRHWGALVAEAGRRYDGHPYLDSVDISSVGYWGEGWSPYMPAFPFQQALMDIYLKAFVRTPLLVNFDEPDALRYGTEHGAGWRLDCLGDMRMSSADRTFEPEMLDVYPQQVVRAGIENVWTRSPVSLETCWVPAHWMQQGWDVDYILDQALRWHVTSLNIKSSAIPPEWKPRFDDFQRRMGYRLLLRRFEYSREARAGSMMPVSMWWFNAGVAPPYRAFELAVELRSGSTAAVIRLPADVRTWLPGDAVWDGTVHVPDTLMPGDYRVRIALLDPRTLQPAVRLAIEGREPDGWYGLGTLAVR